MGRGRAGRVRIAVGAVLLGTLGTVEARAQAPEGLLISAEEMAQGVRADNAVILHVGPAESYDAEHVAGARPLTHRDVVRQPSADAAGQELRTELPEPRALEATLEDLGISDDSEIYVYWSEEWVSPTTRVVYTLQWAGLGDRVHVLNGGLPAWKEAGFSTTDEPVPQGKGSVTVHPRPDLVVDAAWIQAHGAEPGVRIVDARNAANYSGEEEDRGLAGHIPGAVNATFPQFLDDQVRFRSSEELAGLFAEAGVMPGETVVAYCHLGQLATAVMFAARLAGHDVKLYDGSWEDWAERGLPAAREN